MISRNISSGCCTYKTRWYFPRNTTHNLSKPYHLYTTVSQVNKCFSKKVDKQKSLIFSSGKPRICLFPTKRNTTCGKIQLNRPFSAPIPTNVYCGTSSNDQRSPVARPEVGSTSSAQPETPSLHASQARLPSSAEPSGSNHHRAVYPPPRELVRVGILILVTPKYSIPLKENPNFTAPRTRLPIFSHNSQKPDND